MSDSRSPTVPRFFQDAGCVRVHALEWTPMSHILLVYMGPNHELHHRGDSFVTSGVQLVNYTNIRSEGTDSR